MTDQPQQFCCICGEPASIPPKMIGGRVYCDRHKALVNKPHPGFWRAGVLQLLGMGLFCLIVAMLGQVLPPLEPTAEVIVGIALAIVPTALWLWYFYRQDRLEPEPKTKLGLVFIVALALTDFFGRRLIYDWLSVGSWAAANTWTSLLASVFIRGFVWQVIMYVAVRVIVYDTEEFDERMDGIVYGTVAGLGVATLLNLHYVLDNGGVALAPGVVHIVTTALAQASFGGLLGWFMAEAKFTHRRVWFVPLGYAVSSMLNGLFSWLISEVSAIGLSVDPWRSLAVGLAVALAAYFVLIALMRRSTDVTLSRSTT